MKNEYALKMTAVEILESYQYLYDKKNWGFPSLTAKERFFMIVLSVNYLELTGKPIDNDVTYNCPA